MIKERTFVVEDIRAGSIREIEKMITDACGTKIKEYNLWTETDGLQEVKVYLRSLREIIIDLLRHLGAPAHMPRFSHCLGFRSI